MQSFDIVIVGAGIVGLAQALCLKQSGLSVAVIESQAPPSQPVGEPQLRVSALTLASQNVLQAIGAWQHLDEQRKTAYEGMLVWEQDSFGRITFNAHDVNQPHLGYILENQSIQASLWRQAEEADFITLFAQSQIKKLAISANGSFISLSDERMLSAHLVIGADGANSLVRREAGFPLTFWDYDQHAIVATVKTTKSHDNIARQIFTPTGPLAFLPLWNENYCSIVWSQDEAQAARLLTLSNEGFNKALMAAFDGQLGICEIMSKRQSYPLKMRYARQWVADGVVILGDAAHTIHPLAGQGANLGILDAAALAEQICSLVNNEKDFALAKNLRPFERWRKTEAVKMIAAMEGFKRLFSGKNTAKKLLRDVGLLSVNRFSVTKHSIIKQAMGLAGELPSVAKSK